MAGGGESRAVGAGGQHRLVGGTVNVVAVAGEETPAGVTQVRRQLAGRVNDVLHLSKASVAEDVEQLLLAVLLEMSQNFYSLSPLTLRHNKLECLSLTELEALMLAHFKDNLLDLPAIMHLREGALLGHALPYSKTSDQTEKLSRDKRCSLFAAASLTEKRKSLMTWTPARAADCGACGAGIGGDD